MTVADSHRSPYRAFGVWTSSLIGQIAFLLLWGFVWFALKDAELMVRTAKDALSLCITQVIPVLFPVAAAGGLLTCFATFPKWVCKPIGRLFRLSDASVGVLILSLIAGFPIGAMLASRLREAKRIGEEEASRLAAYTNNASAAFLTGCVGTDFFGDSKMGWILWGATTLSSLTVGIGMARRVFCSSEDVERMQEKPTGTRLAKSLAATGVGMVNLTAFVVFFFVFCAFLDRALFSLLPSGKTTETVRAIVSAGLEITGGLFAIASLSWTLPVRMALAGFACGWGGLSVLMQCIAAGKAVSGKRLLVARLQIALLTGTVSFLLSVLSVYT